MDATGWSFGLTLLFNAETGQVGKLYGGNADSEVLLIQNGAVYYRVGDAIHEGAITSDGVKYERTLAKADVIQNAHWAFSSR